MNELEQVCMLDTERWPGLLEDAKEADAQVTIRTHHQKFSFPTTLFLFKETGKYSTVQASIGAESEWRDMTDYFLTGSTTGVGSGIRDILDSVAKGHAYRQLVANACGLQSYLQHNGIPATLTDTNAKEYLQKNAHLFSGVKRLPTARALTR